MILRRRAASRLLTLSTHERATIMRFCRASSVLAWQTIPSQTSWPVKPLAGIKLCSACKMVSQAWTHEQTQALFNVQPWQLIGHHPAICSHHLGQVSSKLAASAMLTLHTSRDCVQARLGMPLLLAALGQKKFKAAPGKASSRCPGCAAESYN